MDFLEEFTYKFALLGEDVTRLRTPEDFKEFDANSLKEFFSGDLLDMLKSHDFYSFNACLLGLVAVKNDPPDFGLMPSLDRFVPNLEIFDYIRAVKDMISVIKECKKSDNKALCYLKNCDKIMKGVNIIVDTGLDCEELTGEFIDGIMELVDDYTEILSDMLGGVQDVFAELMDIFGGIQTVVNEITHFMSVVTDLLNLEIFQNQIFTNIGDFFSGNIFSATRSLNNFSNIFELGCNFD